MTEPWQMCNPEVDEHTYRMDRPRCECGATRRPPMTSPRLGLNYEGIVVHYVKVDSPYTRRTYCGQHFETTTTGSARPVCERCRRSRSKELREQATDD